MRPERLIRQLNLYELLESLIPDFVLGFAFFTSISYAVLAKRFEHQRAAIAMSTAIGFALAIGVLWWEKANNLSIKNLGPIAIGFAIIVLAFVMFNSIKQIGGSWSGAAVTIGVTVIIAQILGLNIPIDTEIVQTITVVVLIIGITAFLSHTQKTPNFIMPRPSNPLPKVRHNMADLYRDRHLSDNIGNNMRNLRKQAARLNEQPRQAGNVLFQIKRMLPAEGYLTEKMAQLRTKAHRIRNGHIARLEETKEIFKNLPAGQKKKAAEQMAAAYNQLVGIDTRLQRLDNSVGENEKRIKQLTKKAAEYTEKYESQKLTECLKQAEKLQKHNSHLFKIIERTERKLTAIAKKIASEAKK